MLSDYTKQRILLEEVYRKEIQAKLIKESKPKNQTWEFLNSSFGLWLLTTVVVGLFTWMYTQVTDSIKENRDIKVKTGKYIVEIKSRLSNYQISLSKLSQNSDYFTANDNFLSPKGDFVFNEFQGKSTRTIMLEAAELNSGRKQAVIFERSLSGLNYIEEKRINNRVGAGPEFWQAPIAKELKSNADSLLSLTKAYFSLDANNPVRY